MMKSSRFCKAASRNGKSIAHGRKVQVRITQKALDSAVEERYKCKNCGCTFRTLINLDSHEIICQLLPLLLNCNFCSRSFHNKGGLQLHIKNDHNSCNEEFNRQAKLVQHRNDHIVAGMRKC